MFIVIENTPGYLPEDDDPATFEGYADAVACMNDMVEEYADQIQQAGNDSTIEWGLASENNYAAAMVYDSGKMYDLGRSFQVLLAEEEE